MKKITISFIGRMSGAIGVVYKIKDTYIVDSVDEFKSKLNMDYDVREITELKGCTITELENANIIPVRDKSERLIVNNEYVRPEKLSKKAYLLYNSKFMLPIKETRFGQEVTIGYKEETSTNGEVLTYTSRKEVHERIKILESILGDNNQKKYFFVREVTEEVYNNTPS